MRLFRNAIGKADCDRKVAEQWLELEQLVNYNDARLFLYLITIKQFTSTERFNRLIPLLFLHVALLIRLSLIDRHLPLDFPSIQFSSSLATLINQFQQGLASTLSAYSSTLSYAKIGDLFDGRLFAFTIFRLHQTSPKIFFDCDTLEIVNQCLTILQISNDEYLFQTNVKELIQAKDIIIIHASVSTVDSVEGVKSKITKISNAFMETFLKPILSKNTDWSFEFVDPEDHHHSLLYEGKRLIRMLNRSGFFLCRKISLACL